MTDLGVLDSRAIDLINRAQSGTFKTYEDCKAALRSLVRDAVGLGMQLERDKMAGRTASIAPSSESSKTRRSERC